MPVLDAVNSGLDNRSTLDSNTALRALIDKKRQQGQLVESLMLERLAEKYSIQYKKHKDSENFPTTVFRHYLQLSPDDIQVREALTNLISKSARAGKGFRLWFNRLFLLSFGIASAGVVNHCSQIPITSEIANDAEFIKPLVRKVSSVNKLTENVPEIAEVPADNTPISIRAVGDVVLGTSYPVTRLPGKHELVRIVGLRETLGNADITLGNLEGVLLNEGKSRKDVSRPNVYSFRMPEKYAQVLSLMGFDVLSLANNHALDFGSAGLASSIKNLGLAGIKPFGVPGAEIAFLPVRESVVAFMAFSYIPGLSYMHNQQAIRTGIKTALKQADLVIVSVHAGKEGQNATGYPEGDEYFLGEYRGNIRKFSEFAIDVGASAVFGHGPHVVRPYELYKGRPIFYSLGNFIGYRTFSTRNKLSHSMIAELKFEPAGRLISARIIPLKLDRKGIPSVDYSPANLQILNRLLGNKLKNKSVSKSRSGDDNAG